MSNAPRLKIGSLILPVEYLPFGFSLVPGTRAAGGSLRVPLNSKTRRGNVQNEIKRIINQRSTIEMSCVVNGERQTININNVFVTEPRIYSQGGVLVLECQLRDVRWLWQGWDVCGHFNLTRRINDRDMVRDGESPNVPGQVIILPDGTRQQPVVRAGSFPVFSGEEGDLESEIAAQVVAQHASYPKAAFRDPTLDWNNEDFTAAVETPRPWTALRMVLAILLGWQAKGSQGFERQEGVLAPTDWGGLRDERGDFKDNGFTPPRRSYEGEPVSAVLEQLCRYAEVQIVPDLDGKIYVVPRYAGKPKLPAEGRREIQGTGPLYYRYYDAETPQAVVVRRKKELTREIHYSETGGLVSAIPSRDATPPMQNVIKLPRALSLPDPVTGEQVLHMKGEYLPIDDVLKAWGFPGGTEWVRRHWYRSFETAAAWEIYGQSPNDPLGVDPEIQQRITAILESWRQVFRLPPEELDYLLDLRGESTVIVDPVSRTRNPAPVWVQYTLIRRAASIDREMMAAGGFELDEMVPQIDYARSGEPHPASPALPLDPEEENNQASPAPFLLQVLDAQLGVVRISPLTSLGISNTFVGHVQGDEGRGVPISYATNVTADGNLTNCEAAEEFHFAAHPTAMSMDPNGAGQYLSAQVDAASIGMNGLAPIVHVFDDEETARYDHRGNLINEEIVRIRTQSIARSILGTFRPRWVGRISWEGLEGGIKPTGDTSAVTFAVSPNGNFTTTLDQSEPRPRRDDDVVAMDIADSSELVTAARLRLPAL